jgi:hypothetical protein
MIGLFRCLNEIRKDNLRKEVEVKEIDYNIEDITKRFKTRDDHNSPRVSQNATYSLN